MGDAVARTRFDREKYGDPRALQIEGTRGLRTLGLLIVPLIAADRGLSTSPHTAPTRFFELAAQVIPILLVVLALEARLFRLTAGGFVYPDPFEESEFRRAHSSPGDAIAWGMDVLLRRSVAVILVVILLVAEGQSLSVVANGSLHHDPALVTGALYASLAAIGMLALFGPEGTPPLGRTSEGPRPGRGAAGTPINRRPDG